MKDSSSPPPSLTVPPTSSPSSVGRSLPRLDAVEKAMGESRYSNDIMSLDALSLALVGSDRPHSRIHRLDISEALQAPGVLRVLTAHDIPGKNRLPWGTQPFLVEGETRFYGEPIALVIAEHPNDAREGARLVQVEYEELPAVVDIDEALAQDAPLCTTGAEGANIWHRIEREQGDVEATFAQCEQVIHREFTSPPQAAATLDPVGLIAQPASDGGVHIAGAIEAPFAVQSAVAKVLDLPYHRVYVSQRTLGGSTGSKGESAALLSGYVALAAWLTGRPVRLLLNQREELALSGSRNASWIKLKYGCSREGEIQACELHMRLQAGAYPGLVERALQRAIAHAPGPYNIPHIRVCAEAVATHTTPFGLLAGYGQMPLSFAQECLMDELAQKLNLDPIALRRNNLLDASISLPWRETPDHTIQLHRALDEVLSASQWHLKRDAHEENNENAKRPTSPGVEPNTSGEERTYQHKTKRGIGIALCYTGLTTGNESKMPAQAVASIRLQLDGSVQVSVPQAKTGLGHRTMLAQIVAERLSVPHNSIHLLESDTRHGVEHPHAISSPAPLLTGLALLKAADPLRQQLLEVAAKQFSVAPNDIIMTPGYLHSPGGAKISIAEAIDLCWREGRPTLSQGHASLPPAETYPTPTYPAYAYAAHVAEIEIDMETFQVKVCNLYIACDMGKAINPSITRREIESKAIFGLGYATIEEIAQDDGILLHDHTFPYPVPTFADIPTIHSHLIESPYDPGPYASKGVGDLPAIGVTPAILNAIAHALGERVYQLPASPERLFSTIRHKS